MVIAGPCSKEFNRGSHCHSARYCWQVRRSVNGRVARPFPLGSTPNSTPGARHATLRAMARVVLEKLSKSFKGPKGEGVHAVQDLHLSSEDKELLVIVGPSGCGKTTTLRLIAGLEEAEAGTIYVDGQVINHVPPRDRHIAMVFQNAALYPHLTVFENMAFGLMLRKVAGTEIETRVKDAAELVGLSRCLQRKPEHLSGGERQRAALGRAIVQKPKLFLFDEPLSNLDAPLRAQMRREIKQLHQRLGVTMLYVTHDQVEAMALGDRVAVMNEGRIQQVADPLTLYRQPANLFVAGFIGSPPMNFFKGMLADRNGALAFESRTDARPGLSVPLSSTLAAKLTAFKNQELTMGVRPEDIGLGGAESKPGAALQALVELVEPLGAETHLHLVAEGNQFVARLHDRTLPRSGEKVSVVIDTATALFFDSANGNLIA